MNSNLENIVENLSLSEVLNLEKIIAAVKQNKRTFVNNENSINNFSNEYFDYIASSFTEKYLRSVKSSFKHLITFFGGNKKLNEITIRDAENFKRFIIDCAPKGYRVYIRTLKASFNIAIKWEYITKNPFSEIVIKKKLQVKPHWIQREDFRKILENTKNKNFADLFLLCYLTGLRLSEATNLRWSNFDFDNQMLCIGDSQFETKSHRARTIPIHKQLLLIYKPKYKKRLNESSYVFTKENGFKYSPEYISRYFKKCCKISKIEPCISFHSMRHSFCTLLAEIGIPLHIIQQLAGHSSVETTMLYVHSNLKSQKEATKKLDQYFGKSEMQRKEQLLLEL